MPKCNNECQEQEQSNSICGAISNVYHVICTRIPEHKGNHVACGSGNVHELEIWSNECNHIIGYAEGQDEGWLCYVDSSDGMKEYIKVPFEYCPNCGEKKK